MKFLFLATFLLSGWVHGLSMVNAPYLTTPVAWDPVRVQVFGKLSTDAFPHPNTYHHSSYKAQSQLLRDLRSRVFSFEHIQKALPSRLFQFKSQYEYTGPGARMMLENSFWTLDNFKRIADVKFYVKNQQTFLSYDTGQWATIECRFSQSIIDPSHGQAWKDFQNLAFAVARDVAESKVLQKVVLQKCDTFNHLMTGNIQINFLFTDPRSPNLKVAIVGYSQNWVKEESLALLNLAFLWSGIEKGLTDEIFGRFQKLINNVKLQTDSAGFIM